MRHFIYAMSSESPAPAGDGDTGSWFRFYKWDVVGETYVPKKQPFIPAEEGDYLWFAMDGRLIGGVVVLRSELPSLPVQQQEIWYNADEALELKDSQLLHPLWMSAGEIPEEEGNRCLEKAARRS